MTQTQFKYIQGLLDEWKVIRNLSVKNQKKNFKVNYTKELIEFFEAERADNEYEMIDALCDMMVVAINAGHTLGYEGEEFVNDETSEFNLTYPYIYDDCMHLLCLELRKRGYNPYQCILETIKELNYRTGSWRDKEGKWVKDKGAYTKEEAIEKLKCVTKGIDDMSEDSSYWHFTIIDENMRKCLYSIKKWYKADYSKCKL